MKDEHLKIVTTQIKREDLALAKEIKEMWECSIVHVMHVAINDLYRKAKNYNK